MVSRFTIAGILIVIVSGLALIFSAIRYLTAQNSIDRLVGAEGFSYALPMLFYAFGLLIMGAFGATFLSKYKKE
ncbi:MAG: hypothetical protein HYY67_02235 [Thaumarchaeota archaeon]|nr:hypothetical protein [Nitrososphaerota archaeon]